MPMQKELIAPCGMNCALCYAYQRDKNKCPGCHGKDELKPKHCRQCSILRCQQLATGSLCSDCQKHCRRIKQLDKSYREKYHISLLGNLAMIREQGMDSFLANETERFTCPHCGATLCVHYDKCLNCTSIWHI